jgi:uncharacterized protein (TIGR03790 family)
MRKSLLLAVVLAALAFAEEPPAGMDRKLDPTKDVAILVNDNVPDSVAIGNYYAKARGIPAEQICHVKTVADEVVSWPAFRKDILEPVKKFLETRASVLYLVPTFGVPVKTSEENPENDGKAGKDTISQYVTGRDYACIDRELELVYEAHEIEGWIPSKLYQGNRHPTVQDKVLIVSRLDGPTPESARALVDNALYGEAYGVGGKALVDVRGLDTPGDGYTECDKRMKECAQVFERAGIPFELDEKPEVVDLATRPALGHYWGWYTGTIVCSREDWKFVRGAVGAHLHSFSAGVLRKKNETWTGPLVQHGITGTFGTVYEPLITGFPDGTLFFDRFLRGYTFGESLELANQMTSWQAVFVGDPLYAPYAAGMKETQAKNRKTCDDAYGAMADALDAGDTKKASEVAQTIAAIGVPYEGARDCAFLARETRARASAPDKKAKGKVEELRKTIEAARVALRESDMKKALAQAKHATELSPASFDANLVLGMANVLSGNARAAVAPLELAAKGEKTAEVHSWLGRALRGAGQAKRALEELDAALAQGADPAAARNVAEILIEEKRFKDAADRLETARKTFPGDRGLALDLARAQVALKDTKTAKAVLDKTVAELPSSYADFLDLVACYETLLVACQAEEDTKRAKDLAELVPELKSGRVKPTPHEKAVPIETALEEAQKTAEKLPDLPVFGAKRNGLPRVRLGNQGATELEALFAGPVFLKASLKPGARPSEVELVPGVYRIAVRVLEKGKPRALAKEQKIELSTSYSLVFDEKLGLVTPKE